MIRYVSLCLKRLLPLERPTHTDVGKFPRVAANALAAALRLKVCGEVRFDPGSRAFYATDALHYRQAPIGVVLPCDTEDVVQTVALCRRYGVPIFASGGGTSLAGQCCNVAVVMDLSKHMRNLLELDPELTRMFREFKTTWDPEGKMNLGKVITPYWVDGYLRLAHSAHSP